MSHFINHTSSHSKFYKSAQQIRCQWEASGCVTSQGTHVQLGRGGCTAAAEADWHSFVWISTIFLLLSTLSPQSCVLQTFCSSEFSWKSQTQTSTWSLTYQGTRAVRTYMGGTKWAQCLALGPKKGGGRVKQAFTSNVQAFFFPTLSHSSCLI